MTTPTIRVLLVEDVPTEAELEVRELRRAGLSIRHDMVDTEERFVQALQSFAPDVILSDFSMPHFDGMRALAIARERAPDIPFIFVSGTIGEEYAIRALKSGATDYVLKTNLMRLPPAVERALADAADRRAQRRIQVELDLARERLTSVFNTLPDMLWSADARGESVLFASPAALHVFGRRAEEFLEDPQLWLKLSHGDDRARLEAAWKCLSQGEPLDIDYRTVWPDGTVHWINQRARGIRSAGAIERVDGIARDVTEQVRQRQRIERLSRIRGLLGAVNSAIVRIRERKPLLEEFCRIAVSRAGFLVARILELDREGRLAIAATTESDSRRFQVMLDDYNRAPAVSETLFALAIRSGDPVVANDVATDPRTKHAGDLTSEVSFALALLPIKIESRLAGLVTLRSREPGFFDPEELGLLSEMVANLSFALELIDKQERITYMALYDALTGLPNRRLFQELLTQGIEAAHRSRSSLGLVVVDLERFKSINDTFGAPTGDAVLKAVAQRLLEIAGDIGRVGRLAGDVFALMLPEIAGAEELARMLESGRLFGRPFEVGGREFRLAGKRGVAVYPDDGAEANTLFRNAEAALKRAKETGDSYVFYAPSINARVAEQVELENRLRSAVEKGELYFHYQPKFELATRRIVGLEALMRWNGPDGKPVSPAKFVPILEQTGLIIEAGRQALAAASNVYRGWQQRGLGPPRIAVNVSVVQFRRPSFVADVRAALVDPGREGGGVDVEITESLVMSDVEETIRKLNELRDMGLHVALDDFGTGYSSLAYLSRLPLDTLKIDRAFVRGMTQQSADLSIITSIVSLARALRLGLVAEGVETEDQAQRLLALGCREAQGFLFSQPVAPERVEALLAQALPARASG
jgi:diguanylate cyclase (GGDEF)-like protein/PAS domain S-box-containing protein